MAVPDTIAGHAQRDRLRLLAGLVSGLCLLALGLRSVALFTAPAPTSPASGIVTLAESVTGPGRVRIGDSGSGGLIVLIDGPETPVEPVLAGRLTRILSTVAPDRDIQFDRFPFARGASPRPSLAGLGELAALGLAAALAGWLVLTMQAIGPTPADMIRSRIAPALPRLREPAADPQVRAPGPRGRPRASDEAASLAAANPARAAAVIRGWLSEKGEAP